MEPLEERHFAWRGAVDDSEWLKSVKKLQKNLGEARDRCTNAADIVRRITFLLNGVSAPKAGPVFEWFDALETRFKVEKEEAEKRLTAAWTAIDEPFVSSEPDMPREIASALHARPWGITVQKLFALRPAGVDDKQRIKAALDALRLAGLVSIEDRGDDEMFFWTPRLWL